RVPGLTWTFRGGLAMAFAGLVWMTWPSQQADRWYQPRIEHPAYTARPWPRVLFDDGHLNSHTSDGLYRPFTRLLVRDGFAIWPLEGRITTDVLRGGDLFVTVNPLGYKGLAQHLASLAGAERTIRLDADAFADDEIAAIESWVTDGGRA